MKRKWAYVLAAGAALVAVAVVFVVRERSGKAPPPLENDSVAVEVAAAGPGTVQREVTYAGTVLAWKEVNIAPKVPGKVAAVLVSPGDRVKEGQLLVELDGTDVAAQVRQAEAAVALAEAGIPAAEINLKNQESNLRRMEELFAAGAISEQQWEQARAQFEAAKAQLTQAERQVEQARAGLELARLQLSSLRITSPISGLVGAVNVDPGEIASPSAPAVTVVDLSKVAVEVHVPGEDVVRLKPGMKGISVTALGRELEGRVATVSPAVDPRTRLFTVKIEIPNPGEFLRSGVTAEIRVILEKKDSPVTVPREALIEKNGRQFVFVVQEGKAYRRDVEAGLMDEKRVEIVSGLQPGDQVVVKGQHYLEEGAPVIVVGGAS